MSKQTRAVLPQLHSTSTGAGWVEKANAWAKKVAVGRGEATVEGFADGWGLPGLSGLPIPGLGETLAHTWGALPQGGMMRAEGFALDDQKWMISTPENSTNLEFVPKIGSTWDNTKKMTFGADGIIRANQVNMGNMCVGSTCIAETDLQRMRNPPAAAATTPGNVSGNMNVTGDMNVGGRLYFKNSDPTYGNNSDPYYLEKINTGSDRSSLRLTMNDNADESLEIWGNSCGESGGCAGPGAMKHRFLANGDAEHKGTLTLGNRLCMNDVCVTKDDLRRATTAAAAPAATSTTGNIAGNLNVKGDMVFDGGNNWILHTPDDGRQTMYIANMKNGAWDWGNQVRLDPNGLVSVTGLESRTNATLNGNVQINGTTRTDGPIKMRHGFADWTDKASISTWTQSSRGHIGPSFGGDTYWSHFPWSDQNTYIRPGGEGKSILIGDIGAGAVNIGKGDRTTTITANGNTNVNGKLRVAVGDGNWNWLQVVGNQNDNLYFGGDGTNRGIWADGNRDFTLYNQGNAGLRIATNGDVRVVNRLCIGDVCVNQNELRKLKQ